MRKKMLLSMLLLLLCILLVVYAMERAPHKFSADECSSCHVRDRFGKIAGRELTEPVTMICKRCHRNIFSERYIHPYNLKPKAAMIPADMPLSEYGELTCNTCHDIHASYFTPYGAPSHFLRRYETGKQFCRICHRSLQPGGSEHDTLLGEAHFKPRYTATEVSEVLDPVSQNCLSCHDGSFATSVHARAGVWSHSRELMKFDSGNHPIGVNYEKARIARGIKSGLKPIDLVDRRIRFSDGKVGCGSCHDPYSNIEKKLVMSDRGSKLCLACHEMDRG